MEKNDCPGCRGDGQDISCQEKPHIQDLCPADREKIAQLVKKLADANWSNIFFGIKYSSDRRMKFHLHHSLGFLTYNEENANLKKRCTQTRHKAETELAEKLLENASLINRWETHCDEHEKEKSVLKKQLEAATSREKSLKLESSKSLNALGDQLDAQEKEFVKLTETVRDLLREKIQLQNALIERDARVRIAESKLERAKETLAMEKLTFIKEHAKDSILRKTRDRATQTCDTRTEKTNVQILEKTKNPPKVKSKDDLEDPSGDGVLLHSLFFTSSSPCDDEYFSCALDVLNCPVK